MRERRRRAHVFSTSTASLSVAVIAKLPLPKPLASPIHFIDLPLCIYIFRWHSGGETTKNVKECPHAPTVLLHRKSSKHANWPFFSTEKQFFMWRQLAPEGFVVPVPKHFSPNQLLSALSIRIQMVIRNCRLILRIQSVYDQEVLEFNLKRFNQFDFKL